MLRFRIPTTRAFAALALLAAAPAAAQHPLDALSADEVSAAARVLRAAPGFPAVAAFSTIVLHEPPKAEVLAFAPGAASRREAFAVVVDRPRNRTYEAVVDLRANRLVSWTEVPGVQPLVFVDELDIVATTVKADRRWQAAMRRRGITDFDSVQIDTWAAGTVPAGRTGRLLRALSYLKGGSVNFYGRPIEGVVALVDMNTRRVVEISDRDVLPLPPPGQELDEASIPRTREAPRPLTIAQPEGASFRVEGSEVRWQNWVFRYSMHPREGLVLHTVGYEDGGRVRPVLYRASLSEMVVPYGDPDPDWRWRAAFDVGEYGVGRLASPLEAGRDAPENALLVDAVFADDAGEPYTLERAVALYERDGGILWKHFESYSGENYSRRARQLVVAFVATIGNYDYVVQWIFHQDGTLELDAGLTGIMLPKGVAWDSVAAAGGHPQAGHLVSPRVVAPNHQHFFSFRLDMDVDGTRNRVAEMNSEAIPVGPDNPEGNAFAMFSTRLRTEGEARRSLNAATARAWAVQSAAGGDGHGASSYLLVPGTSAVPLIAPGSLTRRRAGFIDHHFWATRFNPREMYAAGAYPNQSTGGDGLPRWTADDAPLDGEDVVVWYTLGTTHIPRPEEWPVMPVSHVGFRLIPAGFFPRNPGLDVPR